MAITGDMRASEFRNRKMVYCEIINRGHLPYTQLKIHATVADSPQGIIVKMHKRTVQWLKTLNPWKAGTILMMIYGNRNRYKDVVGEDA